MSNISNVLINKLSSMDIPYEIFEHNEISCVSDGIALLDFPEEEVLKTIGFVAGDKYIFAVLQGGKKLDYNKLIQSFGIKRKFLKMLSVDVVENELGYQSGGLSPIHVDDRINVVIDIGVSKLDVVYCGIGVRNKTLKILSKDLILASNAIVLDLVKDSVNYFV